MEYQFRELRFFLLLYADDLILFSETVKGSQNLLDNLYECVYANKWHFVVKTETTYIVVFLDMGQSKTIETWTYNNTPVISKDTFCYLDIPFRYNNKLNFYKIFSRPRL